MKIPPSILSPVVHVVYRLWCGSLRYTVTNRAPADTLDLQGQPIVFTLWHDELFPIMHVREKWKIVTVVSRSRDGDYLASLFQALGLVTARGSSSRGGETALLKTAKLMLEQRLHACLTVDGPRGPRHVAKKGAVFLAHKAGAPIVPIRIFMAQAKKFRSWDRFQLPWPFSRVEVVFGDPYFVEQEELDADTLKEECLRLQNRLESIKSSIGI